MLEKTHWNVRGGKKAGGRRKKRKRMKEGNKGAVKAQWVAICFEQIGSIAFE